MTTSIEVPLISSPQTVSVTLGGVKYRITVRWCDPAKVWKMDFSDENDAPIALGLFIVTGVDLLEQFGYLGFRGRLFAYTDHNYDAPPTGTNLGTEGHLIFVTP